MKEFLEQTLRRSVSVRETEDLSEKLPLVYQGRYTFLMLKPMGFLG